MIVIQSKANPLIKATKKLLQKKYRRDSYLIEGWHLFEEAQQSGAVFRHVFVREEMRERVSHLDHVILVTAEVLKELSLSKTPQGIIAEVQMEEQSLPRPYRGRYLILEDVQDPGNVGTLVRTADAAGFDAVFLSEKSADIYNDKTLRSMQGSHFHLPIFRTDISKLLEDLAADGVTRLATTLSKTSVDYRELPRLTYFALVMGNEGQGISQEVANRVDYLTHITMPGRAESLNVAVAGGVVIFSLI